MGVNMIDGWESLGIKTDIKVRQLGWKYKRDVKQYMNHFLHPSDGLYIPTNKQLDELEAMRDEYDRSKLWYERYKYWSKELYESDDSEGVQYFLILIG
jgi:hypothetical protein